MTTHHGPAARDGSPGYAVLGHLIIDDLVFADGSEVRGMLGGAGLYAALGAALVGERPAGLVSGVGRDLSRTALDRIAAGRISTAGLTVAGEHTPRSRVVYDDDGARTETPLLGPDHFRTMAPRVADTPAAWDSLRGVYLFAGTDPRDWEHVTAYAEAMGCRLLWEIAADVCVPEHFDAVRALLGHVDIFSANLAEARALCALDQPEDCVATLLKAGAARVGLRMGAAGALVADGRDVWHIGAAPSGPVAEPHRGGQLPQRRAAVRLRRHRRPRTRGPPRRRRGVVRHRAARTARAVRPYGGRTGRPGRPARPVDRRSSFVTQHLEPA
ncbi:LigA protein [Streptomyces himastatinicus ATCC 53653]|uniref:LigA protein n=1 Tax=Streptomyces himastatinicus ATCC 53653 TaxID=457427 RepID=D9WCG7_9ACTN|nr:PfkB family carbohydrate kinase [Streptomyces himastatinicus]EFL20914.1 LigA protein [Streptomyces himastatinicus ATCC 53653]